MSTINAFIRTKNQNKPTIVRFRVRNGVNIDVEYQTNILINPLLWDSQKQIVKASRKFPNEDVNNQNLRINEFRIIIYEILNSKDMYCNFCSDYLKAEIHKKLYPVIELDKTITLIDKLSFFEIFDIFLKKHDISKQRIASYKVVKRSLERFEYVSQKKNPSYLLSFETLSYDEIVEIELFLRNEFEFLKSDKSYKKRFAYYKSNRPRGVNTVVGMLKKLRAFNNWAIANDYTTNYPFKKYKFKECIYGTPIFLTLNELEILYKFNFSSNKHLDQQRDIFVFQSLTGLRVGDMCKLTRANIIGGCVHYIPEKTKKEHGTTVIVPLNEIAKEIVEKYKNLKGKKLLPFISFQQYNYSIKDILTLTDIKRNVTVINPVTRDYEIKPINKIASSHLARRNFIANLYLHVQDQAMLSSLTGHVSNSKSFERYRQITNELKEELVNHLNFKK